MEIENGLKAEEDAVNIDCDGRSVDEIANYLSTKIPADVWEEGIPSNEKASKWAGYVKKFWDQSASSEMLKIFFTGKIKDDLLDHTVQELAACLTSSNAVDQNERQMVGISHEVKETRLTHDFDVRELKRRIVDVFQTFYEENNKDGYYAPYLCFVQSSGMGKTKTMYELCRDYNETAPENESSICGRLVLCRDAKTGQEGWKEKEVFDHFISLKDDLHRDQSLECIVADVFKKLDVLLEDQATIKKKIVFFFDEAHYLLNEGSYSSGKKSMEAMVFRIVRLWICKRRPGRQIVAVFTGTTAKLTNFIIQNDQDQVVQTDTREMRNDDSYYKLNGRKTYKPFFTTTTIGCLRFREREESAREDEYSTAVPFGRPLFASMTMRDLQNGELTIVGRMVQNSMELQNSKEAWLSVLGTRVQMGQTTWTLASSLVGNSYANAVAVTTTVKNGKQQLDSIKICFPPDPVCARLAMCLMDDGWSVSIPGKGILRGQTKRWWVDRMKDLYSGNICAPEKGDLGEVMVALYFLFCADTLRCQIGREYRTFSVPLDQWIAGLVSGGSNTGGDFDGEGRTDVKKRKVKACTVHFNAIQVSRNYIRAYDDSWTRLQNEVFLENVYKTGVGFYVFPGCGAIDLVFALRVSKEGKFNYVPMFVSVKSHVYFSPGSAQKECERMASRVENTGRGALCILVVFGSSSNSDDIVSALSSTSWEAIADGKIVSQVLRIPAEDEFGLSKAFLDLTTPQDEMAEVLVSHGFLGAHMEAAAKGNTYDDKFIDDFAEESLRTGRRGGDDPVKQDTSALLKRLGEVTGGKRLDKAPLRSNSQMDLS